MILYVSYTTSKKLDNWLGLGLERVMLCLLLSMYGYLDLSLLLTNAAWFLARPKSILHAWPDLVSKSQLMVYIAGVPCFIPQSSPSEIYSAIVRTTEWWTLNLWEGEKTEEGGNTVRILKKGRTYIMWCTCNVIGWLSKPELHIWSFKNVHKSMELTWVFCLYWWSNSCVK